MKPLYELITARAMQSWTDPINSTNYILYTAHWIETARALVKEFESIGLQDTAKALDDIASWQERFT
jgi:hypothetical protein